MSKKILIEIDVADNVPMGQLMGELCFEYLGSEPFYSCANDPAPPITIESVLGNSTIQVSVDIGNEKISHGKCVPLLRRWIDIIDSINTRYISRKRTPD